ncbi:MAG: type IX secretion system outer membrane channel protein PorV [Flavobacteriales bacterium]|nr:type IX secretion system outer membrane channel protein PorV [Flavobacteriales bacterium]
MNLRKNLKFSTLAALSLVSASSYGQISTSNLTGESGQQINTITTAVPFLLIAPDSRSSAMGDAGVALNPDANSTHWNASKLAFIDDKEDFGFSISYSPWLRQLVNDINLAYLTGYKKIDKNSAVGVSMRYFSLGNITFTDITGNTIRDFKPNEFAFDVAYSRKLSENFSTAVAIRYINSNLTGGISTTGGETQAGRSVAADVSMFYKGNEFKLGEMPSSLNFGLNVSNIGAKMAYTDGVDKDFIPANLRLGTALNMEIDEYNKLTVAFDANKLLVPTRPIYLLDGGKVVTDANNNPVIFSGKDPNVGTAAGMFQSFIDAPGVVTYVGDSTSSSVVKGSRFKEELNEINLSLGAEYWYSDIFAVRAGYFHEHWSKGNRRFISLGAGVKYQALQLDLSYLLSLTQNSPIANTVRFTLKFAFGQTNSGAVSTKAG